MWLDGLFGQQYPLQSPSISGTSTWTPTSASPCNIVITGNQQWTGQTTSAAYSSVTIAPQGILPQLLLPGQSGAPITSGKLRVDCEVDVWAVSGTISAGYKMTWSWVYAGSGSYVSEGSAQIQPFTSGTNSGSPPSNWGAALVLNSGTSAVIVQVTTDNLNHYNVSALVQYRYLQ
jgi:hypothetical protein